jgi:hypothetical protein
MSAEQLQLFNVESFALAPAQTDWAFDVAGGDDYDKEEYFTQTYRGHKAQFLKTKTEWRIAFIEPTRSESGLWTDTLDRDQAIRYFQQNIDNIIEYQQSSPVADLEKCSGESPKHKVSPEPKPSAPDNFGSGEKPNYYHWVETYWVSRRGEKHLYYRYCWSEGKQRHHCHIRGGNIRSPLAQQHKQQVENAIALGQPPEDIMDLMDQM